MNSKLSKQIILAVIITSIIIFSVSFFVFKYIPENKQNSKVNDYKKELYNSILCQYSCNLTLQQFQNKTEYLPDKTCVENCTKKFKELQLSGESISNDQIKNDRLIEDLSNTINSCKTEAFDKNNLELNNTLFFECSKEKLSELKTKYKYLN